MYTDAMRNPKVAALSDRDYRTWIGLLSVAAENDGHIPSKEVLRHLLMVRLDHLSSALDRLAKARLIDVLADGYKPHSWDKFQYKSDTSAERVTLHRQRKRNADVTPPDTETDTETDISVSKDTSPALKPEHVVEAWNELAGRKGLPVVRKLSPERRRKLLVRIRGHPLDEWMDALNAIERCTWMHGDNDRGWRADFDFLLQPSSFQKLIEGSYDRTTRQ